jgi:hypothetical protein
MSGPARYEIRVEGVLDPRWATWFEGLEVDNDGSQTVISGEIADQAALHGLLNKVSDLGRGLGLCKLVKLDKDAPAGHADREAVSHPAGALIGEAHGRLGDLQRLPEVPPGLGDPGCRGHGDAGGLMIAS